MAMMVFVRQNCAFSKEVLDRLDALHLAAERKYIEDPGVEQELRLRGGRVQVPFLVDEANHAEIYDSGLICNYLEEHYGKNTTTGA